LPKTIKKETKAKPVQRAWQRMLSGRRLDLLDPSPMDIEIEDIAHGLARVARWNGQTIGDYAFNVAQHCMVVEEIARFLKPNISTQESLMALLHDAPEFVIGDMISPFKNALGYDYRIFEDRLERAIHIRFGLVAKTPAPLKKLIKKADRICAWYEAIELAGFTVDEADEFFITPPEGLEISVSPMTPIVSQRAFVDRFNQLLDLM
jgi:5'-deoxynucleotidase YfbR-like HD superfamily hydrolase